jgi:hypothetical protein
MPIIGSANVKGITGLNDFDVACVATPVLPYSRHRNRVDARQRWRQSVAVNKQAGCV